MGDCEATLWEWAMYTEVLHDDEGSDCVSQHEGRWLRRVCGSDDPGVELERLTVIAGALQEEDLLDDAAKDLSKNVEFWA